jgi:hypothetical protein
MSLPTWLTDQIAAARAAEDADGTAWSVYATTPHGLVLLAGAHDRADAQRYLDESKRVGPIAPSSSHTP